MNGGGPLLLDTNVIIEAHRVGCFNAISKHYQLVTVEKCVEETQTGFQNRRPEEHIREKELRQVMAIAKVSPPEEAELLIQCQLASAIDLGEKHLLTHALTRKDQWLVATPDVAAMRVIHRLGWINRLLSLERVAQAAGVQDRQLKTLRGNYSEAWLANHRTKLALGQL